MYCAHCGTRINENDSFCGKCGNTVNDEPYRQTTQPYSHLKSQMQSKKWRIFPLTCLLLIIAIQIIDKTGTFSSSNNRGTNISLNGTYGTGYTAPGQLVFDDNNFIFQRDGKQMFSVQCKITKTTINNTTFYSIEPISKLDMYHSAYFYLLADSILGFYDPDNDTVTFNYFTYSRYNN